MTNMTLEALRSLISAREEVALKHLEENMNYLEVCKQQEQTEKMVEELYLQFEKPERIAIRRHYEGEVHKTSFEIKEAYLQGLRDCFGMISFLKGNEVRI